MTEENVTAMVPKDTAEAPPEAGTQLAKIGVGGKVTGGIIPKTIDDLYRVAKAFAMSGLMPKGIQTPEQVFVAIEAGLEIGLSPMQAVQSIAVINGRPGIYGDAAMAVVRASGKSQRIQETPVTNSEGTVTAYKCYAERTNGDSVEHIFTIKDAIQAGLWEKSGPWTNYPKRMLQMRARGFTLRDLFPDVLKGLHLAEEIQDYVDAEYETVTVNDTAAKLSERLEAAKGEDESKPPAEEPNEKPAPEECAGASDEPVPEEPPTAEEVTQPEDEPSHGPPDMTAVRYQSERPSNFKSALERLEDRYSKTYPLDVSKAAVDRGWKDLVMGLLGSGGATSVNEVEAHRRDKFTKALEGLVEEVEAIANTSESE